MLASILLVLVVVWFVLAVIGFAVKIVAVGLIGIALFTITGIAAMIKLL